MQFLKNQIVYIKLTYHQALWPAIVSSIGRNWVYFRWPGHDFGGHAYRAPVDSPFLDGGQYSCPGRVWESIEAYNAHEATRRVWNDFRRQLDPMNEPPAAATAKNLAAVRQILGLQ